MCWICAYYQRDKNLCKLHNGWSDYYDACLEFKDNDDDKRTN